MEFRYYTGTDYEAVCDFLIALNRAEQLHINWNWARFEWMAEHPEFDKSAAGMIGLWTDGGRVAGAAIYDMYFGEAFCGALPGFEYLYPEILDYAYRELRDDAGLGIAICDDDAALTGAAQRAGFVKAEQTENVMSLVLDRALSPVLPDGLRFVSLDPAREPYDFQWLLWQGFDHGTDRAVFEREDEVVARNRVHFDPYLSVAAAAPDGERVACCCVWYSKKTDYAYIEPVCTVPSFRGKGIAKAVVYEALNRARLLGAARAIVLSDMPFYRKLGFRDEKHFTFYWKA